MPAELITAAVFVILMVVAYVIWERRDRKSPRHGRKLRQNMEEMRKNAPFRNRED